MNYSKPNNDIETWQTPFSKFKTFKMTLTTIRPLSTFLNDGNSTGGFSLDRLLD